MSSAGKLNDTDSVVGISIGEVMVSTINTTNTMTPSTVTNLSQRERYYGYRRKCYRD